MEKTPLLPTKQDATAPESQRLTRRRNLPIAFFSLFLFLSVFKFGFLFAYVSSSSSHHLNRHDAVAAKAQCDQPEALFPVEGNNRLDLTYDFLSTITFQEASLARLSGAVQVPTESFDDMGPIGEDSRWDVMYAFADYLKKTFPIVHQGMKLEVVNTHGLLYTLQGSDPSLKPLLLMSHQDVVPVPNATVSSWTHPPFSGFFDGKSIWGRGASDCKNQLIAVMETMELLIHADYEPKRTVILSFGFDEEISGREGAGHLSKFLIERYGEDGVAALVDEGAGFEDVWGTTFAKPATGEKGYTDVHITIRYAGGHSSIPTDHTSIGMISELITMIEAEQYPTFLAADNPYLQQLQCGAEHSPEFPSALKKMLGKRDANTCAAKKDHLAIEAAKQGGAIKYLMQTSQAVDVINGGIKVNALPEKVDATVNHRVNIGSKPSEVWDRITSLAEKVAKRHNLTLHAFDGVKDEPMSICLWPSDTTLNPAPVTPSNTDVNTPYKVLAGTTRALYGDEIVVTPGVMTGNTDTRYYWGLTKHIFRFGPGYDPEFGNGLGNIHTVDEHISLANHVNMVKWFVLFVRNMDEADVAY